MRENWVVRVKLLCCLLAWPAPQFLRSSATEHGVVAGCCVFTSEECLLVSAYIVGLPCYVAVLGTVVF